MHKKSMPEPNAALFTVLRLHPNPEDNLGKTESPPRFTRFQEQSNASKALTPSLDICGS